MAGTVETRLVLHRFSVVGTKLVGNGTATSIYRNPAGATTSVTKKPYRFTFRTQRNVKMQETEPLCHVLFLELEELDLTLLGLRVFLRAAIEGQKIQLRLQARRSGGILGKLFCDLAGAEPILGTRGKAIRAANELNERVKNSTLLQAKATLYAPNDVGSAVRSFNSVNALQPQALCEVVHLILGPLHLDLLGLIVDLNKIMLDIWGVQGTTIGDLFCSLSPPNPPPPPPAP